MSHAIVVKATGEVVREIFALSTIVWPNGDVSHDASEGFEYLGWIVAPVEQAPAPNEFYNVSAAKADAVFANGVARKSPKYEARPLDEVQRTLLARIDVEAEQIRQVYVTPGAAQAMVYLKKLPEAEACLREANPKAADYPLLAATLGIEGDTILDVARLVVRTAKQWAVIAGAIEKIRKTAKAKVNAAKSVDEAAQVYQAIRWVV